MLCTGIPCLCLAGICSHWSMSVPSQMWNIFNITLPTSIVKAVILMLAWTLLGYQPKNGPKYLILREDRFGSVIWACSGQTPPPPNQSPCPFTPTNCTLGSCSSWVAGTQLLQQGPRPSSMLCSRASCSWPLGWISRWEHVASSECH